ncbi:histidine kinase [Desulfofarcimen acetoxidans DSM 771]|uniref:histidine kinase n=1 Tax=Desulfofarcimen acetoxidans (strain ATCC 49208 / DSM 771 / KCTC 5769 / VKM B-1644 / 5575) TaxID=485916 RepID=C8W3Q0_DESAS|nr:ATP-binding protein [Desulfofarcimen acetoxidans]ACV63836.1 histidine kinase [Desulfofarcimen acetoxidans DSM 771]
MIFRSIVGKLWLAILVFVVVILAVMSIVQNFVLKDIYLNQQSEQLIEEGRKLAAYIEGQPSQEQLADRIKTVSEVLNASVMVVDRSGIVIQGRGGMHWGMMRRHFQMFNERGQMQQQFSLPIDREDLKLLLDGQTVVHRGYNQAFEMELLWAAIPVRDKDATQSVVFIHTLLQPIAERINVLYTASFYILGGVLLLAVILSLFLSRSLSRPLLQMNQTAQAITRGDYSRSVPVRSKDEIGLLAASLNSLSQEIQEKITAIERLDQTRRDFVANVSHELRTPLTIIQGYTEALLDGFAETEEERQQYLNNVLEESQRLQRLVNDVLDLRSLESGKMVLYKQKVDLTKLLAKVAGIFKPFYAQKQVFLSLSAEEVWEAVYADPDRLEQVFVNLIDNALRHTPAGGEVKISSALETDKVFVTVKDSGPGISSKDLPLIWERFYKVDKARSRGGEGSGLGLAITKAIIDAHGGWVEVTSEPGRGTVMTVCLPVFRENAVH